MRVEKLEFYRFAKKHLNSRELRRFRRYLRGILSGRIPEPAVYDPWIAAKEIDHSKVIEIAIRPPVRPISITCTIKVSPE